MPSTVPAASPPEISELHGAELRAVASLWQRSARRLVVRFSGSSMEPTIPSGCAVLLQCGEAAAVGDIIAFVGDERLVVHRVVGLSREQGWILTRGDAYIVPDPPITDPRLVFGRILEREHAGEFSAPAPPPRSIARRLTLGVCLAALRHGAPVGGRLIRTLLILRRWLFGIPKAIAVRIRDSLRPSPASR